MTRRRQGRPAGRPSRSAGVRPTWTSRSGEVEPVEVHDLVPRGDEVVHELLLRVVARVDLGERAQLGVRAEDEVDAAAGPLDLAGGARRGPRRSPASSDVAFHVVPRSSRLTKKSLVSVPGRRGEDAERRLLVVRAQDAQAADEDGHLGGAQGQQVRPVEQQVLGRQPVALAEVVAEPVRGRLERGEGLDVGLLLRGVRAARA